MPLVFRDQGFRFFLYFNEGDPREPAHVHVTRGGADAKFWLSPTITLAYNRGFNARTQADLSKVIQSRRAEIERAWSDHFR